MSQENPAAVNDAPGLLGCRPFFTRRACLLTALAAPAALLLPDTAFAAFPSRSWPQKTPAQVGLDQARLDEFRTTTGNMAGIVIRQGYDVCRWGNQAAAFDWASASKPVTALLLLFALKEKRIGSVDDRVTNWGWSLIAKDQTMTLRHLVNMASGYALPEKPGAAWAYNDYGVKLAGLTVSRIFKQSLDAIARNPNRLGALQFQDGALFDARGNLGISTTPRDFARIGWLVLNKFNWNGRQLLPSSYYGSYIKSQVPAGLPRSKGSKANDYLKIGTQGGGANQSSDARGGYGFFWWINANRRLWPDAPADTIQARGHQNAESMVIMPSLGLVVAWKGRRSGLGQAALADANRYFRLLAQAAA